MFICLIGIDGSGKTTLCREILKKLYAHNMFFVYVWCRFEPMLSYPFIAIFKKLFLNNKTKEGGVHYSETKSLLYKNKFLIFLYLLLIIPDMIFQIFIKITLPLLFNKHLIVDRYYYDTLIDILYDTEFIGYSHMFLFLMTIFKKITPKPLLTYLLDLPEDIAYSRKNDVPSMNYLTERRKLYIKCNKIFNAAVLDATLPINFLSQFIFNKIKKEMNL